jgi:hypothetical protein
LKFITSFLCVASLFAAVLSVRATDEPLIPAPLNAVLPKITAGMTREDMKKVLSAAYPKLELQDGPWSGQTGYIGFRLDAQYSVMFSAKMDPKQREVVSSSSQLSVFDRVHKLRLDITRYHWEKAPDENASKK